MSPLSALLASFFFFVGFATAGTVTAPVCTDPLWTWTFNSLDQSPCLVAAALLAECYGGSFTLDAIPGPNYDYVATPDLCACSTVTYSLLSACGGCQGGKVEATWVGYTKACPKVLPPQKVYAIPAGIRVPFWATLDVTIEGKWDDVAAELAGDLPEYIG